MMSCVFAAMIAAAIICGAANGSIAAVLDALTDGFDVIEVREENDWVAILAKVR